MESLKTLTPDEAARTNELLANLTDIIIAISGTRPDLRQPLPFVPDPNDVRNNIYWSLALILTVRHRSISIA